MNLHRQVYAHMYEHVRAHTQYIWVTMADGERVHLILVPRKKKHTKHIVQGIFK